MRNKFLLWGEFANLNDYIKAERGNRFAAAKLKKEETERVYWELRLKKVNPFLPLEYPLTLGFDWYTKDLRVDADNICFSRKFILDGMVMAKIIENDSRKFINGFSDNFFVDKESPRVEIYAI